MLDHPPHGRHIPPETTEPLIVAQQLIPKVTKISQWACGVRMEIHLPVSGRVWLSLGRLGHELTLAGQLFVKNTLSNFVKIRQAVYSLLPGNGQTDGWTWSACRAFFLGASAKLRKATVLHHFGRCVRPSVRPHETTLLPLHGFSWNLIAIFTKICWQNLFH